MANEKDNIRSWIVLSVVTFSLFLEVGLVKSFSVLLPDITEQLSTSTWVVGSSISIILGWGSFVGKLPLIFMFIFNSCKGLSEKFACICFPCAPQPLCCAVVVRYDDAVGPMVLLGRLCQSTGQTNRLIRIHNQT